MDDLYRAVDKRGRTVDFLLSERRDVAAAKRHFSKAIKKYGTLTGGIWLALLF